MIHLKTLELSDISADYVDWMNNPDVTKYTESRFMNHTRESVEDYVRSFEGSDRKLFGIFVKDLHIGNISFSEVNRNHGYASVGIIVGRLEYWNHGLGTKAIKLMVEYGFTDMGLRRIEAGIYSNNIASIKAFEKAGFVRDGGVRNRYLFEGRTVPSLVMSITNNRG